MRVLHVAQPLDAGVPAVVAGLVEDQASRGWDVHVAHPAASVLSRSAPGAQHHLWEATRSPGPGTFREAAGLSRLFRQIEPDLVHLHSAKAGLAGRAALRGRLPVVFQPHAWSFEAVGGLVATAAEAWERRAARWTDVVLCVGRTEKERGVGAGVEAAWEVVPNGVDLRRWPAPDPGDREAARDRLGFPASAPLVVCVGRLSRQKGQDVLVSAWPGVTKDHPDARLVIVGDGDTRSDLEASKPDGVLLTGAVADPRDYLLAADLVAISSRWEGMSLSMLEAMACARSVVSTEVAGAEVVATAGAGAVVLIESPHSLGDAISVRLEDRELTRVEGERARRAVEADHDLDRVNARVAAIYETVLERRVSGWKT